MAAAASAGALARAGDGGRVLLFSVRSLLQFLTALATSAEAADPVLKRLDPVLGEPDLGPRRLDLASPGPAPWWLLAVASTAIEAPAGAMGRAWRRRLWLGLVQALGAALLLPAPPLTILAAAATATNGACGYRQGRGGGVGRGRWVRCASRFGGPRAGAPPELVVAHTLWLLAVSAVTSA